MLSRRDLLAGLPGLLLAGKASAQPRDAKDLIVRLEEPYCAEARLETLADDWMTPLRSLYILNHGDAPRLDRDHVVTVDGMVGRRLRLSLDQLLAGFRPVTQPVTLMCAGNRRSEHRHVDDPPGWGAGAVGNAWWTGIPLHQVLAAAGVAPGARFVLFEGADRTPLAGPGVHYGNAIPLEVALRRDSPVVLAHLVNGQPLPRAHGFPLRTIVPGYIGARSVKWLRRIVVSAAPSDNPHFTRAHRIGGAPIWELPTTAVVACARHDARARRFEARGYALSGSDPLLGVEASLDDGATFVPVSLGPARHEHTWRLWRWRLPVDQPPARLTVRAVARSGWRSPRRGAWNPGGYLYDGWHVAAVTSVVS